MRIFRPLFPTGVRKPNSWPALPARIGLRMEAPVQRIVVLPLALRAHGKLCHRSLRPVVGDLPRNGEAIAAILGVQQLPQAIRAGGRIGWNPGAHPAQHFAGGNSKARLAGCGCLPHCNRVNARQGRSLRAQSSEKGLQPFFRPLDRNRHPVRVVAHKARQLFLQGKPVDERTKAHPLYDAADQHFAPFSIWLGFFSHRESLSPENSIAHRSQRLATGNGGPSKGLSWSKQRCRENLPE